MMKNMKDIDWSPAAGSDSSSEKCAHSRQPQSSDRSSRSFGPGAFTLLLLLLCSSYHWYVENIPSPGVMPTLGGQSSDHLDKRVSRLMSSHPLIDTHIDLPELARAFFRNQINGDNFALDKRDFFGHVDIPRMRDGRVGGAFWSVYTDCPTDWNETLSNNTLIEPRISLQQIDVAKRIVAKYPKEMSMASTAKEFVQQWKKGKIAGVMGAEGLHQVGESMAALRQYHALGVRYITLTHFCNNRYADSCSVPPRHNGLSKEGIQVVREMNRVGLIVDLSHTSADTQRQALEVSTAPVIFSHSGAQAVFNHERNAPDDVLYRLKDNGGVISIVFLPEYLSEDPATVNIDTVVDHVLHVVGKIGWKHVGIGSDFDGMLNVPKGLASVANYPALIKRLIERSGASDKQISGFMGGNILRVWKQVEIQSNRMQRAGVLPYEPDEL